MACGWVACNPLASDAGVDRVGEHHTRCGCGPRALTPAGRGGMIGRVAMRLVDAPPREFRREIAAALEALLKDPSAQTRKVAAQALGTWGDAAKLPAVRAAAGSGEARVAEAARQAIAEIERRRP